jgi:hypothetical protein
VGSVYRKTEWYLPIHTNDNQLHGPVGTAVREAVYLRRGRIISHSTMINFFNFTYPHSERLMADFNKCFGKRESILCPISSTHDGGHRRSGELYLEVKHNRRDEQIIWAWGQGCAMHQQILDEFEKEGFSGFRLKPAKVCFRDGVVSTEYQEFLVTGWAGIASPESGIRLLQSCPACQRKEYSPITNYENVIDWSQWTGEDFFIVWPLAGYRLVTERVAQWLLARKVKSFRLEKEFEVDKRDAIISKLNIPAGRLSLYFPEDLAIKYGRPLGLE